MYGLSLVSEVRAPPSSIMSLRIDLFQKDKEKKRKHTGMLLLILGIVEFVLTCPLFSCSEIARAFAECVESVRHLTNWQWISRSIVAFRK